MSTTTAHLSESEVAFKTAQVFVNLPRFKQEKIEVTNAGWTCTKYQDAHLVMPRLASTSDYSLVVRAGHVQPVVTTVEDAYRTLPLSR